MSVVYGRRGVGKTFFALDVSLSLASLKGTVVYCPGEGTEGLRLRRDAWLNAHPSLKPFPKFRVLAHDAFPRLWKPESAERFLRDLEMIADKHGPPVLVVVDTWRNTLAGTTVNADEATTEAQAVLRKAQHKFGSSSLVLHHPRKPSREERHPPEAGSGALVDNADLAWKMVTSEDSHEIVMYNEKIKEWDTLSPLRLTLRPKADSLYASPSAVDLIDDG